VLKEKQQREVEIMVLLDSPRAEYDADHALVLVQMLDFRPGQLYLYEKLHMVTLILEHYMNTGQTR
jgi:vacuolar protein sorting-associated protein 11